MLRVLPVRSSDLLCKPVEQALFATYAEECSIPVIGEPSPQADTYRALEDAGALKCFGLYDGPALVGFASVLVSILPHYGKRAATVESIFVAPQYRNAWGSGKLIKAVEAFAGASGCVAILYSAPEGSHFAEMLANRDGYYQTNVVYCRRLA